MDSTLVNSMGVYNLASGKTFPQWLSDKQKRSLAKDEEYRRRIELLQDFDFPTASSVVSMSPNGRFVIASGTYPPQVKVFEVEELGMKFERHLDAEVVSMLSLSDGYEKLAFLQADRTIAFHAAYGSHTTVRVPQFGRCMSYQKETCDMLVAGAGEEIFRFNLHEGRFRLPVSTRIATGGINAMELSPIHQEGVLQFLDGRMSNGFADLAIMTLNSTRAGQTEDITCLGFDSSGLKLVVGTSGARCLLYDLRSSRPLQEKEHQYGLPLVDTRFHYHGKGQRCILSTDSKMMKAWDMENGNVICNVETPSNINGVCIAHDGFDSSTSLDGHYSSSGVILFAGEQSRVMAFYVPALGPAPRWCSFLDSLTEELEEASAGTVYDDYKFITETELQELGGASIIGTPLVRAYMHGFFIDMKIYNRLRVVSEPFAYEEYRKRKIREKIEKKAESRISVTKQKKKHKVNAELAERLLLKRSGSRADGGGVVQDVEVAVDGNHGADIASNPTGDERFAAVFQSADFEMDPSSEEYRRLYGPMVATHRKSRTDEEEEEQEDLKAKDELGNSLGRNGPFFQQRSQPPNTSSTELLKERIIRRRTTTPKFSALLPCEDSQRVVERAIGLVKKNANGVATELDTYDTVPLGRRLEEVEAGTTVNDDSDDLVKHSGGGNGIVREFKYIPKSDGKKKGGLLSTTKGHSSRRHGN